MAAFTRAWEGLPPAADYGPGMQESLNPKPPEALYPSGVPRSLFTMTAATLLTMNQYNRNVQRTHEPGTEHQEDSTQGVSISWDSKYSK